jgi:hypothetical protein
MQTPEYCCNESRSTKSCISKAVAGSKGKSQTYLRQTLMPAGLYVALALDLLLVYFAPEEMLRTGVVCLTVQPPPHRPVQQVLNTGVVAFYAQSLIIETDDDEYAVDVNRVGYQGGKTGGNGVCELVLVDVDSCQHGSLEAGMMEQCLYILELLVAFCC